MATNDLSITWDQGSTLLYVWNLALGTSAMPLTGFTAEMMVRRTYGSSTVLIHASSTGTNPKLVIEPNATVGAIQLTLSPTDTSVIKFNEKNDDTVDLVYDLEVVDVLGSIGVAGGVYKCSRGTFVLRREVTR